MSRRAEMKRQQKEQAKKGKTFTLNQEQIQTLKQNAYEEAMDMSFGLTLAVACDVLARLYWEKTAHKKIPEFVDECLSLYESMSLDIVKMTEIIKDVEEVAGIKLNCVERLQKWRKQLL